MSSEPESSVQNNQPPGGHVLLLNLCPHRPHTRCFGSMACPIRDIMVLLNPRLSDMTKPTNQQKKALNCFRLHYLVPIKFAHIFIFPEHLYKPIKVLDVFLLMRFLKVIVVFHGWCEFLLLVRGLSLHGVWEALGCIQC